MTDVLVVGGIFREVFLGGSVPASRIGGTGISAAVAAGRLGAKVALVAPVGDDDVEEVRARLDAAGVDATGLITNPGASGTFVFTDRGDLEAPAPVFRTADAQVVEPTDVPAAAVKLVFGHPEFDPLSDRWLGSGDAALIWDRQGWLSRTRTCRPAVLRAERRRFMVANLAELRDEFGLQAEEILQGRLVPGFEAVLVKAGPWGVTLIDERGVHGIPAFDVEVRSAIGSGDVFAGALAAGLAAGLDVESAARRSAAAAAVALGQDDPLLGDCAAEQIERLLVNRSQRYIAPLALDGLRVGIIAPADTAGRLLRAAAERVIWHLGLKTDAADRADLVISLGDEAAPPSGAAVLALDDEPHVILGEVRRRAVEAVAERCASQPDGSSRF